MEAAKTNTTDDKISKNLAIEIKGLKKSYYKGGEELVVLENLDLSLEHGKILSIQGTSGSGKSTLLNIVGGMDHFDKGLVKINSFNLNLMSEKAKAKFRSKELGFVFQNHHLLPDFTLLENVAIPLLIQRKKKKYAYKKAQELLLEVGLENRIHHYPSQISGGESQRASIARAVSGGAGLLIADEPTGNLDSKTSDKIIRLLWEIQARHKLTLIVVTHDNDLAAKADIQGHIRNKTLETS